MKEEVVDTSLHADPEGERCTPLAYQGTKSLRPKRREELFGRHKRIQTLFLEAIEYGVRQRFFAPGRIASSSTLNSGQVGVSPILPERDTAWHQPCRQPMLNRVSG